MSQNASKCTISKEKMPFFFWGGGTPPLGTPDPTPVNAFGASIRVPSALDPPDHISGYWLLPFFPSPSLPFPLRSPF